MVYVPKFMVHLVLNYGYVVPFKDMSYLLPKDYSIAAKKELHSSTCAE